MIRLPTRKRVDLYVNTVSPEQLHKDLAASQEFMFDAWETDDLETVLKLIRKAIKKSPLCADAYSFYSGISEELPETKVSYLETAVYAATIALGDDFQQFSGSFWGFVETRPYMRARAALAEVLWECGKFDSALAHYREMVELNPADNQGIRYVLAASYLELEMTPELSCLLGNYPEDKQPYFQYSRVLLAYRTASADAVQIANEAIMLNHHIPALLSKRQIQTENITGYLTLGGLDEAVDYVNNNIKPWIRTPGAIEWLSQLGVGAET